MNSSMVIIYEHGEQIPVSSITLYECGVVVTIFADGEYTLPAPACTEIVTPKTVLESVE